jgi:hypothetical protein
MIITVSKQDNDPWVGGAAGVAGSGKVIAAW